MNNSLIAIFNEQLEVIAFVQTTPNVLNATKLLTGPDAKALTNFVQSFRTEKPVIRKESNNNKHLIVTSEITEEGDKNYQQAVLEKIRASGFIAKIVPENIQSLLIFASEKLTLAQRQEILGEIVNLSNDTDSEAISELQDILTELLELSLAT